MLYILFRVLSNGSEEALGEADSSLASPHGRGQSWAQRLYFAAAEQTSTGRREEHYSELAFTHTYGMHSWTHMKPNSAGRSVQHLDFSTVKLRFCNGYNKRFSLVVQKRYTAFPENHVWKGAYVGLKPLQHWCLCSRCLRWSFHRNDCIPTQLETQTLISKVYEFRWFCSSLIWKMHCLL